MFKSIFSKYFAVVSSIIVVSFLLLQGAQLFLSSRFWLDEKHHVLQENAHTIADHTAGSAVPVLTDDGVVYRIQTSTLSSFMKLLSASLDCTVVIADMDGAVILMYDEQGEAQAIDSTVSLAGIIDSAKDDFYAVSTLNGLYDERQYTAGVPIRI